MSSFAERLDFPVASGESAFSELAGHLDAECLGAALKAAEFVDVRRRRLPAEQVMVLVLAMALFRDRSIHALMSDLNLGLGDTDVPVPSASVQARSRVGVEPLRRLFCVSSAALAGASTSGQGVRDSRGSVAGAGAQAGKGGSINRGTD
jgi:hypothetical protein